MRWALVTSVDRTDAGAAAYLNWGLRQELGR
jgi:hypothetical protein